MKKIESILNPAFSNIIDMLQRIIIYYADPDSLGSFAKVSLNKRRKNSIQNGCSLLFLNDINIPLECVEDVYDTIYDKDGTYTECEIVIWDNPKGNKKCLRIHIKYLSDCILIFIPKCYLDLNNLDKYSYAEDIQKRFYGEWVYVIRDLYDYFYESGRRLIGTEHAVYLMRSLFVSLGFIKSSYTVNIDDEKILYSHDTFYKGMHYYEYYQAVIWTINNSSIEWDNNSASENINKLLDGFDSYDVDYWADLVETIEEAKAFAENDNDSAVDVDEIVEESDISCSE